MPNLQQQKSDVFGIISAYRTLTESYPKFDLGSLFTSISNSPDQIQFTIDLFTALGNFDQLKEAIAKVIVQKLTVIENAVKKALKILIRENIACNIDPSMLDKLKSEGIKVHIDEFDLLQLMRINPTKKVGKMFYFGMMDDPPTVGNLPKSKDLNAFLWYVVHEASGQVSWPQYSPALPPPTDPNIPSNIATFEFTEGPSSIPGSGTWSNTLTVRVGSGYEKLHDFNSDWIDSIVFFDKEALIGALLAKVFGSINISIQRTREEIFVEDQIQDIINRLSQCVTSSEVDDSFFSFDNETYNAMLIKAENVKRGRFEYCYDSNMTVNISTEDIASALEGLSQTSDLQEQTDIFTHAIDTLVDKVSKDNPRVYERDKFNFKINILKELIVQLSATFSMLLVAPKLYLIILINLRLLGITVKYSALSFLQENLNIVTEVLNAVKDAILDELLQIIKEMAIDLASRMAKEIGKDQLIKFRKMLETLVPGLC
jgi:hypothetical protein